MADAVAMPPHEPASNEDQAVVLMSPSHIKRPRIAEPDVETGFQTAATHAPTGSACAKCEVLARQNRQLQEEVQTLAAQLSFFSSPRATPLQSFHNSRISVLPSGREVRIAPEELVAMRQIFELFDKDADGMISVADLAALHEKLGEPITAEEAVDAVRELGQGKNLVSFDDFCAYWDGTHPSLRQVGSHFFGGSTMPQAGSRGEPMVPYMSLDATREQKRRWYQARFKFVKAKVANPTVGRISSVSTGADPSLEFRVRFYYDADNGVKTQISPWHDVPLRNDDGTYNFIVEIPKWSRRKYEIATGEVFNPIKQDVKNGTLREYGWGDMMWNYGALPQTWEDPKFVHPDTGFGGDNDPIDIVELGSRCWSIGSIVRVKVLGVLGLIDAGETDWKILAISAEDPLASSLNDIDDVQVQIPGVIEAVHRWLKFYKTPVINDFAFEGKPRGRAFAEHLIEETNTAWRALIEDRGMSATVEKL